MENNSNYGIRVNVHEQNEEVKNDSTMFIMLTIPNTIPNYDAEPDNPFERLIFNQSNRNQPITENINAALDSVNMLDIMGGLFGGLFGGYGMMTEEEIVELAQQESLHHYKTQEKKPNVRLEIDESVVTSELTSEQCTICASVFEIGEKITKLECKHTLHTECIGEWVKYKSECPICRANVKTVEI